MSKYTPGPWEWDEDEDGGPGVIHASDILVAYFPWRNCNEPADARLIAAAPDLLEALEVAWSMLGPVGLSDSIIDQIESAIAKATK
jgi:hypothetical protein